VDALPLPLRALAIGFAIAAVIGPIGLLCIERTLRGGLLAGLSTGLGVALADGVYALLVGLGAAGISEVLLAHGASLRIAGGLAIAVIGLKVLLGATGRASARAEEKTFRGGAFASAFLLTLANPTTILSFVAIFAGLGLAAGATSAGKAAVVVVCIFTGSLAWWVLLSFAVAAIGHRLSPATVAWINRAAGAGLMAFGLWAGAGPLLA
jgi:threonine/homoserine/homoserine lactone efflux protein